MMIISMQWCTYTSYIYIVGIVYTIFDYTYVMGYYIYLLYSNITYMSNKIHQSIFSKIHCEQFIKQFIENKFK